MKSAVFLLLALVSSARAWGNPVPSDETVEEGMAATAHAVSQFHPGVNVKDLVIELQAVRSHGADLTGLEYSARWHLGDDGMGEEPGKSRHPQCHFSFLFLVNKAKSIVLDGDCDT